MRLSIRLLFFLGFFFCFNSQLSSECAQNIEANSQITSFLTLKGFLDMNLLIAYRNQSICIYRGVEYIDCIGEGSLFSPVMKMIQVNTDILVTLTSDNELPVFKISERKLLSEFIFSAHLENVNSILYLSPKLNGIQNPYLVLSSELNRSIIWDVSSGDLIAESSSLNSTSPMVEGSDGIIYTAGSYLMMFTYSTVDKPNITYDSKFLKSDVNNIAFASSHIMITQRSSYHVLFFDRNLKRASKELIQNSFILDNGLIFSQLLQKYFFSTTTGLYIYNNELDLEAHLLMPNSTIAPIQLEEDSQKLYYANGNSLRIIDLNLWPISFTEKGVCERVGTCFIFNCELCLETNKYACRRCARDFFKYNGTCLERCPFKQSFQKPDECCSEYCESCLGSENCTSCQPGSFLSEGVCISCANNCLVCSELESCKFCQDGFYLNNERKCEPIPCKENYFYNLSAKACQPCLVSNCDKCREANICEECKSKFQLLDGVCQISTEINATETDQQTSKVLIWVLPLIIVILIISIICYVKYIKPKFKLKRGRNCGLAGSNREEPINHIKDPLNEDVVSKNIKNSLFNDHLIIRANDDNKQFQIDQFSYPVLHALHEPPIITKFEGPDLEDSSYRMNFNDNPQLYLPKAREEEISSEKGDENKFH